MARQLQSTLSRASTLSRHSTFTRHPTIGAIALELTTRYALEEAIPYRAFIWLQSVALGLWQGIAMTLVVAYFALAIRRLRDKPLHAVAASIGASACEMLITAIVSFLGMLVLFTGAKSDRAQFNLAYDMAVRQKKPAEALPLARKALALSKGDAVVLDTVGWIEHLRGNTAEAARLLVQAAKGAPRNADVRLHTAIVLAAQGARGAAAAELAEALKLNPALAQQPETQTLQTQLRSGQP